MLRFVLLLCAFTTFFTQAALPDHVSGTLAVVNKQGNSISVISLPEGKLQGTLETGRGPHELVIDKAGTTLVSTDYAGGNSLSVFDLPSMALVHRINFRRYPRPHGIQFLPDMQHVMVSSETARKAVKADIRNGTVVRAYDTGQSGSHMIAVFSAGTHAVTTNMGSDSLSVIDLGSGALNHIAVEQTPEALALRLQNKEIWYGTNKQGLLMVRDSQSGEVLAKWEGFGFPYRVLFSADQHYAVVPDLAKDEIRVFDPIAKKERYTINLPRGSAPQSVFLHPDDRTLFVSLNGLDKVRAIDLTTRETLAEFATGQGPDGVVFSPFKHP